MKTFAITIIPESPFGTPLKGDTIFGQFCWQAVQNQKILTNGFDYWIDLYHKKPFAVFSSAFPQIIDVSGKTTYYLPKPAMPVILPANMSKKDRAKNRKILNKKKWLKIPQDNLVVIDSEKISDDTELFNHFLKTLGDEEKIALQNLPKEQQKPIMASTSMHNSINRQTMTTSKGFDPFSTDNIHYLPGLELVVFVTINEDALDISQLEEGLYNIGILGFGKDASTGLGRFRIGEIDEISPPQLETGQGCFTLSPSVPEQDTFSEQFSLPFTRFGRHGDQLVLSKNPFKNPIVMADEGSIFFPHDARKIKTPYIGTALTRLSQVEEKTVAQGYSLYLPFNRSK